jgi:predicted nucleotidyltransferase
MRDPRERGTGARRSCRIAAGHGARNVRIFGSVVRGEAGEGSDG